MVTERYYTTGEIASICQVAPRTVAKWFDKGLLAGHRIHGGVRRRVTHGQLVTFLRERGLPLGSLEGSGVALVIGMPQPFLGDLLRVKSVPGALRTETAPDAFTAGLRVAELRPAAIVLDFTLGRWEALALVRALRAHPAHGAVKVPGLAGEDEVNTGQLFSAGCDRVMRRPFDPVAVATYLEPGHPWFTPVSKKKKGKK